MPFDAVSYAMGAKSGGGGSSGGGVFDVTIANVDDTLTCNKTAGEIMTAVQSGKIVRGVYVSDTPGYEQYTVFVELSNSNGEYAFYDLINYYNADSSDAYPHA